jgi:hypothetical protein
MGARNLVGIGLLYRPARLLRLAGRYDNSVSSHIDCSIISALISNAVGCESCDVAWI